MSKPLNRLHLLITEGFKSEHTFLLAQEARTQRLARHTVEAINMGESVIVYCESVKTAKWFAALVKELGGLAEPRLVGTDLEYGTNAQGLRGIYASSKPKRKIPTV